MNPIEQQHAAEKEVREITASFEAGFDRVKAYDNGSPLNVTVYVPLSSGGRVIEHAVATGFGDSPEEAIAKWKAELAKQPQLGRMLFWRVRPEVRWSRDFRSKRTEWAIYSRFAVDPK